MAEFRIEDNGDGSTTVTESEMSMDTWLGLLPRKRHWWQPRVWVAASDAKQPEKHMGWLRRAWWAFSGV